VIHRCRTGWCMRRRYGKGNFSALPLDFVIRGMLGLRWINVGFIGIDRIAEARSIE
jgi:hypothetical protein